MKREILGDDEDSDDDGSSGSSEDEGENGTMAIEDHTGTDLVNFRRKIYLTIMSALNFEEVVHKLLKIELQEGMEVC